MHGMCLETIIWSAILPIFLYNLSSNDKLGNIYLYNGNNYLLNKKKKKQLSIMWCLRVWKKKGMKKQTQENVKSEWDQMVSDDRLVSQFLYCLGSVYSQKKMKYTKQFRVFNPINYKCKERLNLRD